MQMAIEATGMRRVCFLHMPKCGGTSVRLALEALLGDRLLLDYGGLPGLTELARHRKLLEYTQTPEALAPGCCVFGHYRPVKYLGGMSPQTSDIMLVTILRDPIERLISLYRYLIAINDSSVAACVHLKEHDYSFEWFSLQNRLRNHYSRHLFQIPFSRIDALGVYEDLDRSWAWIARLLRPGVIPPPLPRANSTDTRSVVPVPRPLITKSFRSELEDMNAQDLALYEEACRLLPNRSQ